MKTDRRNFLIMSILASCSGLSLQNKKMSNSARFICIADGEYELNSNGPYVPIKSKKGALFVKDNVNDELIKFDLPFRGHGIDRTFIQGNKFVTFEKWGYHMALTNFEVKKIEFIVKEEGRRFFGHGVFSSDGMKIYATQYDDINQRGVIGIYDSITGRRLGEYLSYGVFPHDLQRSGENQLIVINRKGAVPEQAKENSLAWIDARNGKLIKKIDFNLSSDKVYYHFCQLTDGWIVASGAFEKNPIENSGVVQAISPSGDFIEIKLTDIETKGFIGESLSLAAGAKTSVVAITSPAGNTVYFWDFKENKILEMANIETPHGIFYSEAAASHLVSSAKKKELWQIGPNGAKNLISKDWGNGSHIYIF